MAQTIPPERLLLVAEPDREAREQTARDLSDLGYEVVALSPSALQAIEAAGRYRPQLVLVSAGLPGALDGPAVARAIDEIYRIPAVVVTEERQSGFSPLSDPAPYGVLRSPFDVHELQTTVETSLRRAMSTRPGAPGEGRPRPLEQPHGENEAGPESRPFGDVAAGAFEATLSGDITDANGALVELLGYDSREDILTCRLSDLVSETATCDRVLDPARDRRRLAGEEVRLRTKQGGEVIALLCSNVIRAPGPGDGRLVGTVMDITERKRREADLERLAFEDPLTGLANRRALDEHAEKYLALARRRGTLLGLIYLDVNRFKVINDRFGHPAGDAVLVETARRLRAEARESDVVSRVGGDEFVVLLPDVEDLVAVVTVARRMKRRLEETPIELDDAQTTIRAEAGISVYPEHGSCLEELIRAADQAMYRAKDKDRDDEEDGRLPVVAPFGDDPASRRVQH